MRRYSIVFAISLALTIVSIPAFAQEDPCADSAEKVCVAVSETNYEEGDTIIISGKVNPIIGETPLTMQIFFEGNLIEIAQLTIAQDGTFTDSVRAQGPLWGTEGNYTVRATYGQGVAVEDSFQFFPEKTAVESSDIFEVDAGSSGTFDVRYSIRGGTVADMIVDADIFALVAIIESDSDGEITLELPRDSIDAKTQDDKDDTFIILIDGIEVPYQEISSTASMRKITIEFEEGDSDIEIIGTFVIPEFGTIAVMILAVAIISTIIVSSKRNLFFRL